MPENVRQSVRVGSREVDESLKPLLRGDGQQLFFTEAQHVLERTPNYSRLLDDAKQIGFDTTAINAGFIAGLKAASEIFNLNYEFLIEP